MNDLMNEADILNNLANFGNTVEEIDPEASTTDRQPPPPAGRYYLRVRLRKDGETNPQKLAAIAGAFGQGRFPSNAVTFSIGKPGKKYAGEAVFAIWLDLEVVVEGQKFLSTREYVSTGIYGQSRISRADDYLRALTGQAGVGLTAKQKIERLHDLAVTEPLVVGEVEWEGQTIKIDPQTGEAVKNVAGKNEYEIATLGGKRLNRMVNFPFHEDSAGVKHYKLPDGDDNGNEVSVNWVVGAVSQVPSAQ